jgi:hypothetical protein
VTDRESPERDVFGEFAAPGAREVDRFAVLVGLAILVERKRGEVARLESGFADDVAAKDASEPGNQAAPDEPLDVGPCRVVRTHEGIAVTRVDVLISAQEEEAGREYGQPLSPNPSRLPSLRAME